MKARIRKTGEVVDIITFSCSTNRNKYDTVSYIDSKGVEHKEEHLNYYWDFEEIPNLDAAIDWEQRRYEIAKDILTVFVANPFLLAINKNSIDESINLANALIRGLKRSNL